MKGNTFFDTLIIVLFICILKKKQQKTEHIWVVTSRKKGRITTPANQIPLS